MSDTFNVRLATMADSQVIAWHRARMFQDMGYVPAELFDYFRAKSEVRLREALASGEYVGWLATEGKSLQNIVAGAGVQLRLRCPATAACIDYAIDHGSVSDEVCYWRDMTLVPHLLNLFFKREIRSACGFALAKTRSGDRKQIARQLREEIVSMRSRGIR